MTSVLPTDVSADVLAAALDDFRAAVGADAVLTDDAEFQEFRDPYWFKGWDEYDAAAVVQPKSVEEIQAIVRIANARGVPLWVTSQGRNNGYGGSSPRTRGSIVVNLRRIEPRARDRRQGGIRRRRTRRELLRPVRGGARVGHPLWISVPDLGWGSVIGNSLEYGVGYTPYGEHAATLCGLEVVLPNGELLRTGMGALENPRAWHVYRRSYGPSFDGLFFQSNFGIVTRAGVWLMPRPESFLAGWAYCRRDEDLAQFVDVLRTLLLDGSITGYPQILSPTAMASVFTDRSHWYDGEGALPDEIVERICAEMDVGRWTMRFAIHGDEAIVDHKFAKVKQALEQIPDASVVGTKYRGDEVHAIENPAERVQAGVPNLEIAQMAKWYGGERGGTSASRPRRRSRARTRSAYAISFAAPSPRAASTTARRSSPSRPAATSTSSSSCSTRRTRAMTRTAFDACKALVVEAAKLGYGEYRAHLDFMDLCADQYAFGDHAQRRLAESIKDTLDPNGILMPGKQGIWPSARRTG